MNLKLTKNELNVLNWCYSEGTHNLYEALNDFYPPELVKDENIFHVIESTQEKIFKLWSEANG
jgi:hypothetical protein